MSTDFKGKVIAITGAASGIAFATSKLLAERGAILAMADRNEKLLDTAVSELKSSGATVTGSVLDVRDAAAVESWIQATVKEHGKLDGAANLAGVIGPTIGITGIEDIPLSEFDFIIDVNLKGVFNCLRAELKAMHEKIKAGDQKLGSIVNAASIAGLTAMSKNPAYITSKHAVVGLTRAAAKECGGGGVRVNAIAPGVIDTPMVRGAGSTEGSMDGAIRMTPMHRIGQPEEVAEVICWLLCERSSYVTGIVHPVDGGWTA